MNRRKFLQFLGLGALLPSAESQMRKVPEIKNNLIIGTHNKLPDNASAGLFITASGAALVKNCVIDGEKISWEFRNGKLRGVAKT